MKKNKRESKKRAGIVWTAIAAGAIIIVCSVFWRTGIRKTDENNDGNIQEHQYYPGGLLGEKEFFFLYGGEPLSIKEEARKAVISSDGKHVGMIDRKDNLYVCSKTGKNKVKLAENAKHITCMNEEGILYVTGKETGNENEFLKYWYLYKQNRAILLGDDVVWSKNAQSLAWSENKGIYTLKKGSSQPELADEIQEGIHPVLINISPDGNKVVWGIEGNPSEVYLSEKGDRVKLGELERSVSIYAANVLFLGDSSKILVAPYDCDKMIEKEDGKDAVTILLNGISEMDNGVYSPAGKLEDGGEISRKGLYVKVRKDGVSKWCEIGESLASRELSADVKDICYLRNGVIIYLNQNSELVQAKINENVISEQSMIAADINKAEVSEDGSYVYYFKNVNNENNVYDLYFLNLTKKEEAAQEIASDVGERYMTGNNGKTIAFIQELRNVSEGYKSVKLGDLYVKQMDKPKEKIAGDVISGYLYQKIEGETFPVYQFTGFTDDSMLLTYGYYNGKEYKKISDDVKVEWAGK